MGSKGRKEVPGDVDANDRDAAIKHLMQIPYVGKKTAGILYDNGFRTIREIQSADEQSLAMVASIGKKLGKKVKAGAEELEVVGGPAPEKVAPPEEPAPPVEEPPEAEPPVEEKPAEAAVEEPRPEPSPDEAMPEPAPPEETGEPVPAPVDEGGVREVTPTLEPEPARDARADSAVEEAPKEDLPYEVPEDKPVQREEPRDEGPGGAPGETLAREDGETREAAHDESFPVEEKETLSETGQPAGRDAASMLLQWQLDGYDVGSVEKMIFAEGANQDEILAKFTENIRDLDSLKTEIGRREFPKNMDEDVKSLVSMLNDPMKVAEIGQKLRDLDGMKRAKLVEAELDTIEGMDKEKEEIRALMADPSKVGVAESKVKKLKRAKKESFFELEFTKHLEESETPAVETKRVVIDQKPAVAKSRVPMIVEAVFLTNQDGKPMSFRTRKPRSEVGMGWLKGAAGSVRQLILSSRNETGGSFDGTFEGAKTLVCKGELSWLGIVYAGEEHPLGRKMLKTALGVMEAKHYHDLKGWDGKTGVTSVGKSMNAIIPAFIKLNRMAKS